MKTPKHEPSSSDDKSPRRPRPLKPASWLEEVRPDDDVMAVFYGRSPAKVAQPPVPSPAPPASVTPVVDPPAAVVAAPIEPIEPAGPTTVEPQPVSRETELWSPGLPRETMDSRGRPEDGDREPVFRETGLPFNASPVSRISVSREAAYRETGSVPSSFVPAGEARWPSRRYKVRVQTRIPQSLNDELTAYCDRRGVTRDAAIDRAIRLLLYDEPVSREAVSREAGLPEFGLPVSREPKAAPHDHEEDHDRKIIMIFERETGRRFRADERGLVAEFRNMDAAIVESAIRYAVKYSREPVGSFAYCAKVIRQRAARRPDEDPPVPNGTPVSSGPVPIPPADDDRLRFDIRTAAARLRESRRDDPTYTHERLVDDVRSGFVVQGREVGVDQIEEALRGLAI